MKTITLEDNLVKELLESYKENKDLILKAYEFIKEKHKDQKRKSGEDYIVHPLKVALIVKDMNLDISSVITALLHDTLEDTNTSPEEIENLFGKEIRTMVEGLTKISKYKFSSKEEAKAENYRKMLISMAKDIRIVLIKLADRLHNLRTLEYMSEKKQIEIARETLDIYAPIAHRFGMWQIKRELEDLSFKYLNKEEYEKIKAFLDKIAPEADRYLQKYFLPVLIDGIKAYNQKALKPIEFQIKYRRKNVFSVYNKLKRKNLSLNDLQDILGVRIIVGTAEECYTVLGIVHSLFRPVPGSFDDYISMPKPNFYQSIHTAVEGPKNKIVEVQIRTKEMDERAEKGIAAHWAYKENKFTKQETFFSWLRDIVDSLTSLKEDPKELIENVKNQLFSDEVFVFTPKNDIIILPEGSTVLDFAYYIHSELGNKCVGAFVNGKFVSISYVLQSGDKVEIIKNQNQKPSIEWLKIAKTQRAKAKIKQFLKALEKENFLKEGKSILYKLSQKLGLKPEIFIKELEDYFNKKEEDLYIAVGSSQISLNSIIKLFKKEEKKELKESYDQKTKTLSIDGVSNIKFELAPCCNPLPGDKIVGVFSKTKGLVLHIANCKNALYLKKNIPQKALDIKWENSKGIYKTNIRVLAKDRVGILGEITSALSKLNINISKALTKTENNKALMEFEISVKDIDELNKAMETLKSIKDVEKVYRLFT